MIHVLILEDDRASMEALEKILMEYPENICVHAASSYEEQYKRFWRRISGMGYFCWM